ncbi:MAG: outer membrane beta-barrel protein, partial [Burkholderiaceae bacterium]
RLDNSTTAQNNADRRFTGTEFGVRYAPGTGNEFDLVYRRTDGKYPNRQVVDALGQPLLGGAGIDNGFNENAFLVRVQYKPNEDTTISGQAGLTRRSYDTFTQRDFSGPTARLTLDWRPGGAFFMGVDLVRDIAEDQILSANYVDLTELRLRPTIRLTGKTSLAGLLSFQNRDYGGDPGFATGAAVVRKDKINRLGFSADWQYSRNILVTLGYERVARSSNYPDLDYNNNILSIGAKIKL